MPHHRIHLDISFSPDSMGKAGIKVAIPELAITEHRRFEVTHLPPPLEHVFRNFPDANKDMETLGKALFNTLFAEHTLRTYDTARGYMAANTTGNQPKTLQIRINLNPSDELSATLQRLPWEALFDPHLGSFLAFDQHIDIVRSMDLPGAAHRQEIHTPLRILAIGIDGQPERGGLATDTEFDELEATFKHTRDIELQTCRHLSLENIGHTLVQDHSETAFNILHFIGHSSPFALSVPGSDDPQNKLGADYFADLLRGMSCLQLIVLNSCQSADAPYPSPAENTLGFTQHLLNSGVPAVISMHGEIADASALLFSKAFYTQLATGSTIDVALAQARRELRIQETDPTAWLRPVLFTRSRSEDQAGIQPSRPDNTATETVEGITKPIDISNSQQTTSPPTCINEAEALVENTTIKHAEVLADEVIGKQSPAESSNTRNHAKITIKDSQIDTLIVTGRRNR